MLLIDRIIHLIIRISSKKNLDPILPLSSLIKLNEENYPLVTVQVLICNEICFVKSIINSVCQLDWPEKSLFIHILDDSTDKQTIELINIEVEKWKNKGKQIAIQRRDNRIGFKAGSLKHAFTFYPNTEYIAIFDVDFLPKKDFLYKTIPYLINDSNLAFVQTRWSFYNAKDSFLTRMQELSLNYHHKCEQVIRCYLSIFFTFNGTGGVWRRLAIKNCGGWQIDTLVEDLDLSFRVHYYGWKSIYLEYVDCQNELPPTYSAYLSQQHRWTCGSIQVMRKTIKSLFNTKYINWKKKLFCFWFLLLQFYHILSLIFLIILISCIYLNEFSFIVWLIVCLQTIVTMLHVVFTPEEWYMCFFYVLFQNAMVYHRVKATIIELFDFQSVKQWEVTPKYGLNNDNKKEEILEATITSSSQSMTPCVNSTELPLTKKLEDYKSVCEFNSNEKSFINSLKKIYQKLSSIPIYKGNFFMAILHFIYCYIRIYTQHYEACLYGLVHGIMYLIFAFGYLGRFE